MKFMPLIFAGALTVFAMTTHTFAAEPYKGEVQKVDEAEGKVTLKHGAIKKFDMEDGMTMVYRVSDPSMLKDLKAGDRITFDADKVNSKFTITKMEKAK